jgi:2-methylcitrate synthase
MRWEEMQQCPDIGATLLGTRVMVAGSNKRGFRFLPPALKEVLERIPKNAHPMDVLRTGASMAGVLEPERDFSRQDWISEWLLASLPSMLCYWYRFSHDDGVRIELDSDEETFAGHFLTLLHNAKPSPEHQRCMDVSLILYAEHEFNASTFTARVCAATLSDFYSCVTGAIGTLRGPLHGGANEAAMELVSKFKTPQQAREAVKEIGYCNRLPTMCSPSRGSGVKKRSTRPDFA